MLGQLGRIFNEALENKVQDPKYDCFYKQTYRL